MLKQIDLRELAEMEGAERAFLSFYSASGAEGLARMGERERRIRALLADDEAEVEHFDESLRMIREALEESSVDGPIAVFSSWALDFLVGFPLSVPVDDLLWIDSSPFIRPLAELQSDYATFLAVRADNHGAQIYLVSATAPVEVDRIRADVKNRVKKGGWSQKRYQRRRENELQHYGKEVAEAVEELVEKHAVEHVVLFGSLESRREIRDHLAGATLEKVVDGEGLNGDPGEEELVEHAMELLEDVERGEDETLWQRIRTEMLAGGLAAGGPKEVLAALREGRVETLLVDREAEIEGMRCRECELLAHARPQQCPQCKSSSVFHVDLVNELVELAEKTSAETEFTDPIEGLTELGGVAATLRY